MSSSGFNTCRSHRLWHAIRCTAVALIVSTGGANVAYALDPSWALSQYIRQRWGSEKGFPGGPVYGIAQGADGYLWIAAEKGLVRFDGLTFRLFEPPGLTSSAGTAVLGMIAAPDGSLWARLRGPALLRYRDGAFDSLLDDLHLPDNVITALLRSPDGTVFVASLGHGVVSWRPGERVTVVTHAAMPGAAFPIAMARGGDGSLWLGTRDTGVLRVRGAEVTRITAGLPDLKVNCLLPADDGTVWMGTDRGVVRWTGKTITTDGVPAPLDHLPALAMIQDRASNIWVAAGPNGLYRMSGGEASTLARGDRDVRASVTTVFEDRDGNLWVGTDRGIERWRDGVFATYSTAQGLPSDAIGPIFADTAERVWLSPIEGGLYWMRDGVVHKPSGVALDDDVIYSIAGSGSDLWVGRQRGGLTRLRARGNGFVAAQFTQADGLAQNSVYAVYRARDGAVWAGTLSGGVSRHKDGKFTTFAVVDGLASNTVASIAETPDGTMWFATPNGLSALSRGGWRRFGTGDGLPANDVSTLFEDGRGRLWTGTTAGIAVIDGGRVLTLQRVPRELRASILGIAEDPEGRLWLSTADRVLSVHREALVGGALRDGDVRSYGAGDGLVALEGVKRHRSLVSDPAGRIWVSTAGGVSMTDPRHAGSGAMPAIAQIERLSADGELIDLHGSDFSVPPGRRRISFGFAGLSLAAPERVMFRYRLDGFDREWSAPSPERQAAYTNLAPGSYRFRVLASNSDGLWNGSEATLRFDITPTIWQAAWFRLAVVALAALAIWGLFRLRMLAVASQLNLRFEERLTERTRIAQELHDTLLQGFVSASMQLHVAVDRLPADSAARGPLAHVLDLMSRVIEEGRTAVRGLRSPASAPHDLEQAFAGVQQDFASGEQTAFRVVAEGRRRPLNPVIRDEVYRVGREALANAVRHAGAKNIELELEYGSSSLRLMVRDDGRGIDPGVVRSGSDGHWGLPGMRERAERIGARFKVSTRAGAGTEVELTVPGHVAFADAAPHRRRGWMEAFLRGRPQARPDRVEKQP